ncbi:MAG TPA: glycosyltransferase, partial [Acidimicrobiia bacterium]|nr:glycosyltransferase [Acidimicrobiia bacterium]
MHAAGPVFSHRDFDPRRLAARKEETGLTVSLCIPARDEAATIGRIVETARRRLAEAIPLLDEILVVDDHSSDGTADAARSAGAKVVHSADLL